MRTEILISEVVIARMLMPLLARPLKHWAAMPGVAAHADADDRHLHDVSCAFEVLEADPRDCLPGHFFRAVEIALRHREGDVRGLAIGRDVLDDHVHVDVGIGQRTENALATPGLSSTSRIEI
jgi:hypothetical protein